jgi:hypothetical protein
LPGRSGLFSQITTAAAVRDRRAEIFDRKQEI